jgi:acetolactate synthase small subunit
MHWIYQITAASKPHVLPRLVQFFAEQSLAIRSLDVALLHQSAQIKIAVETEPEVAHRLQDKLAQQAEVRQVELITGHPPAPAKTQRQRTRTPTTASIL